MGQKPAPKKLTPEEVSKLKKSKNKSIDRGVVITKTK